MVSLSNTFRTSIVALRESRGFNQEELAERCGVSRLTISRWERGETWPQPDQIEAIANVFKVGIDELFGTSKQASAPSGNVQQLLKSLAKNADLIEMIANIDNAETIQLIKDFIKGNAEFEKSEAPKIPLYESPASCGAPLESTDKIMRNIPQGDLPKGEYFACHANGESMSPTILHDDILIFKKASNAKIGEVVIAKVDGEITVKRLAKDKLEADNKKFKPIKGQAQVLGVLVKIQRDF